MSKLYQHAILVLFLLVVISKNGKAQQQAEFSLYNQFAGIFNPSAIPDEYRDYEHNMIFGINGRRQWTNLKSGPNTQSLRGEYITNNQNTFNLLMGAYFLKDKIGPISTTGAYLRLATIMSNYDPVFGGFSAGFQLGGVQYDINTTSLHQKYSADIVTGKNIRFIEPQLSLGISYYNSFRSGIFRDTKINTGISMAHLGLGGNDNDFNYYKRSIHYYAYGKIKKTFSTGRALEINTWARYVKNTPVNVDAHLLYDISEMFSIEAGINTSGIAHIGFGVNFLDVFSYRGDLLHLNYSYNPSFFLQSASAFGNTHEVNLSYSLER